MIPIIKKLFFSGNRSSSNLFLALPVLILVSVGCLCSGKDEPRTCVTADGANLIWAGSELRNVGLADGRVTSLEPARYADVICAGNNEVIVLKEDYVRKNNESRTARTAVWRNSPKTYRLADIESFQKYYGFIQNRYFVSGSRGFVERSRSSGKSTIRYRVYDQPQIFTLEDSQSGELKSHYLYREKLGLPETRQYDELWFYVLSVDENGSLLFGMHNKVDQTVSLFKLNMFDGSLARTGGSVAQPKNMRLLEKVVSSRDGKFAAFVYEGEDGTGSQTLIDVRNTETNQTVATKTVRGVSYIKDGPDLFFDDQGTRLAILVEGVKLKETGGVRDVTVFDLATGGEISRLDLIEFFKKPDKIAVIRLVGDDVLLTYSAQQKPFRSKENRLCKVNVVNKQIVWDVEMP
ncbi:MAG TPA: hypothetical protein VIL74_07680 [Pyrinomonadaceae bacterium]|jgi:hypothetical protein